MGSKIQGITVEIGGDTTKLGNALKEVSSQSKSLQNELKGVNSLLKMDPSNVTLLKQKQDLLNKSIIECKEKLDILKSTQAQVQAQFEKGEITEEQYRDFQREIVATETKLKSLENEVKSFGSVGSQQIAVVGTKMQGLGENIEGAGKRMLGATATIAAAGTAAAIVGSNFDDAMKQVAATMGITVDEINNGSESYKILEETAKECGETTKFSASESAEALNYLALAGYDAQKSAETLPKVLNLAAAGGLDLATASDMVTDAMAALGMETSELDKYIDEMAKTAQKSNTSVAQLGEATLTCAGTVKMSGMSLETMNAELGVLANNGIKGAEGGTHLRNIILSLTSPTDKASAALKNLGISVLDSQGNIKDLNDIMVEFDSKLSGLSDGEKTEIISTIFNKTDISAVNALIKGSGEEFSNLKAELDNCSGAAENMADTMNSSMGGQITLLKSQLEGIAIQISEILMPVLKSIIEKVSNLLSWISKLSPQAKTIIVVIAGIVASVGPLLITVGKLVSSIGSIMTYGPKIVSMFGTIKTAVSGLFAVIAANPIILVITAIIAAIVLLWNKCEWFRNLVTAMFEAIKLVVSIIWNAIVQYFQQAWEKIQAVWEVVEPYFMALWEGIKIIFSVVANVLGSFFSAAWNAIKVVWDFVYPYFQMIWENIKIVFSVVSTVLGGFFQTAWTVIKAIWDTVSGYFNAVWETIKGIFSVVSAVFQGDFEGAWEAIKGIVDVWASYFQNIWDNIKNVFSTVADFFKNSFQAAWDGIKNIFGNVGTFFQNIWNTIKNMFTNIGTTIGNAIGNAFKNVVNSIISFAENTINNFIRSINTAISVINNIPGVNISTLRELNIPKLKVGMANVPYDDYLALLHKGERVLTAEENKEYTNENGDTVSSSNIDNSFNLTINSPTETSPSENARLLRKEIQKYRLLHT